MKKLRTVKEATRMIERMMYAHLGSDWRFNMNNRFKRLYGRCDYLPHIIHIATDCALYATEEHLIQMVLHEIAHGLSGNVGHGKVYKDICRLIGCKIDTPYFDDYANLSYLTE